MSDSPEDIAKRAHAMGRLGGIIFKSQAEIDQKAIATAESPDDEQFVGIAERVKAYIEEVGIEIRFGIQDHMMRFEMNVDFNVAPRPWIAELLVATWHSARREQIDRPTASWKKPQGAVPYHPLTDVIRIRFDQGEVPVIEHSIDDMATVVRVLAGVRDRLLADHEEAHPKKKTPDPKN